jgi:hypothetical protein
VLVGLAITDSTTRAAEEALEYEDPDAFRAGEDGSRASATAAGKYE